MEECIICAELIGTTDRLWSITECGHSDICSQCFLRIRSLQDNMKCPSCKTELEYIICSNEKEKLFGSYERWGDTIVGYDHIFDSKSRMFMPSEYSKTVIDKLWLCKCSTCGQTRRELRQLRGHMSAEHNLMLCLLCIENKHCFPSEQKIYTQSEYEKHLRNGDGDGSNGHPSCEFCRKRYYDSSVLFTHLNKDHYSCHLCDKMGIMYKYYNKYGDLEHHFRRDHFLCEQKSCLERKFTAFANEIDLANHNRAWHPDVQSLSRIIPIHFSIRRSNQQQVNEEVQVKKESQDENTETFTAGTRGNYEGGLGGRANDGEWQVQFQPSNAVDPRDPHRNDDSAFPNHAPDINSEEFPALEGSAAGGGSIISNRWVTKGNNGIGKSGISRGNTVSQANRKKTLEEDFPTLNKVEKKGGGSHSVLNDYNQKISANTNSSWGKKPSDSPFTEDQMIAQAIAESMNISNGNYSNTVSSTARPQGYQPMKVSITDQSAFPTLSSDESSNVTKVQSKPKPVKKAPAQAGWGDALKSVGMKAPQKKATGFSIVKTVTRKVDQSSVATKKSSIDSSGSNTIALPPPPNLANDNYPSLSISRNPREGKWVTMGGAGNHNK